MKVLHSLLLTFLFLVPLPSVFAGEFIPWSENVFTQVNKEYGAMAEKRLRFLHTLLLENQDLAVMDKLELVNKTINHLPWIADQQHWNKADYWATPMETITTFGGDCEDIAIVKWVVLSHLGIPDNHLRLAYAKIKKTGESHMVLVYIENPEAESEEQRGWVLDNYTDELKRGNQRRDLLAVYVTDAQGNLTLISDTGTERSVKGVFKERKMKKLEELKRKIAADRKKYKKINDGRPLLPKR